MLGPYRLIAGLGRGGQAEVFLALRRGPAGFSKLVVVKSIRQDLENDPRSRAALVAEARLAARLQHPNVVQTLEVGEDHGQLYIAMEFLDGQPLSRVARAAEADGRPLDVPAIAAVLSDLLAGLHAAHELRDYDGRPLEVIHRDVSPQNVFLTHQGEVKLVDFGVARASSMGDQTQTGIVKGKPAYMAPEQAMGQPIDRRIDLYAAGIVAWELLARRRLFTGESPVEIAVQQQPGAVPPLASVAPGVPPAVAAVIDRALAYRPEQRFATAQEMRDALEAALAQAGLQRTRREELGALVSGLFERDRARLQEEIRRSVAASERGGPEGFTPATLPSLHQPTGAVTPRQRPGPGPGRWRRGALIAAGVIAALALGGLAARQWVRRAGGAPSLRLCGSRTIGNALAGALAEGFLRRRGLPAPERTATELGVTLSAGATTISVEAEGSAAAFRHLADGQCDLGMASRAMTDEEAKAIGELRTASTEQVIALDAIAVLVHPMSQVRALDMEQLRRIFSGELRDWAAVGGAPGPIEVDALDEKSTTWETFRHVAMGSRPLTPAARRFDDSANLSDRVSTEPSAIGFAGLAFVRSAAALAIAQPRLDPTLPSPFTVASESYPLSRRLYLYALPRPHTPLATDFLDFALSTEGQQIVRQSGFVDLSVALRSPQPCDARCPADYAALTAGALRLTLDLRFREGTGALDSRAARDVDRVVGFLRDFPKARLLLLGFADTPELSQEQARTAAREFSRRGVTAGVVRGFGAAMPIWPDADAAAHSRNRRVEVWMREEK